jgi:hypothetical protein
MEHRIFRGGLQNTTAHQSSRNFDKGDLHSSADGRTCCSAVCCAAPANAAFSENRTYGAGSTLHCRVYGLHDS